MNSLSLQFFPVFPVPVVLLFGLALFGLLAYGSRLMQRRAIPKRWIALLGTIRLGMIVLFCLALLRPVVTAPRTATVSPDAIVMIDTSESMSLPATEGQSRLQAILQALPQSDAIKEAAKSHRLHWFTFDRRAQPVAEENDTRELKANGSDTDIASSLESAVQQVRLRNASQGRDAAPVQVLLASDGLDRGDRPASDVAAELGLTVDVLPPPPVYASTEGADAVIVDLQGAPRVLMGSESALLATVRANSATKDLAVVLKDGETEVDRRPLEDFVSAGEGRVFLTHRPAEAGPKRLSVQLVHAGKEIGEPRHFNSVATDRRHDVLLLENTWRWEWKFLKRSLEDDPSFSLTALVSRGEGVYVQFGEPDRKVQLGGFPRTLAELDGFETVILGNVDVKAWSKGFSRVLNKAVGEGGKSLVVIAGPQLGQWADDPDLSPLLPVDVDLQSGQPLSGRVELQLTPEGRATSWFLPGGGLKAQGSQTLPASAMIPLPPMEHIYPVIRKKPAARTLVETSGNSNAYGPLVVMAEQTYGRGRVLFVGTDTLWQWQTLGPRDEKGVTLYTTFWQQALRAMAPPEPTSSAVQLWLKPERTVYRARDRVNLSTEIALSHALAATPMTSISTTAQVVAPDGRRIPLTLQNDPQNQARRLAQFDAMLAGRYRIEATARSEARPVAEGAMSIEVLPPRSEKDSAPVDLVGLQRLASATGGRIVDPASGTGWLDSASAEPATIQERRTIDLWQNFTLLGLLCVLLGADWTLRLFRGYV